MQICGIVAEFNPFHNGHQYIINKFKDQDNCILSVMSGNFVQRGEPALFSKFTRTEAALSCGVDLVIELPSPWSCSCAQNFSYGAISLLKNCSINKLFFGSESGDANLLGCIATADRNLTISNNQLKSGKTYAQIRQAALTNQLGVDCAKTLDGANNNLGIEYIKAMQDLNCEFEVETVCRYGPDHDSASVTDSVSSASYLRELVESQKEFYEYVPSEVADLFRKTIESGKYTDFSFYKRDVISFLRRLENFDFLPDLSEGIENKLLKELRNTSTYEDLLNSIKSKRYTLARIRRLLLSAYLGIGKEWFLKEVPYINVLGFSKKGEAALRQIADKTNLPIIISCKSNKPLEPQVMELLNKERIRTDLYMSLQVSPSGCGYDYTNGLIKAGV